MNKYEKYLSFCRAYKKYPFDTIPKDEIDFLHTRTLEILKEIVRIFDDNKIQYCAVGGTLLGAYLYNKFIPWDEDIDIAVFEEDYDRMIDVLIETLPQDIVCQCNKTEPKYYHEWIKVRDTNSVILPKSDSNYTEEGVWVDIYKLQRIKKSQIELKRAEGHKKYLLRRLEVGNISEQEYYMRVKKNKLNKRIAIEKIRSLFSSDKKYGYLIGTASKPFVDEDFVFPLKEYQFEDMSITSFNEASKYLLNHYGEGFVNLPPENERYIAISGVKYNLRNYTDSKSK